ncbi:MAG TPA: hypothetical protein VM184_05555 [Gaiellaceae bacterium]|nr:hypothetical protein [Gaiellaceae bacterium]
MGSSQRANLVWLSMVLGGVVLGTFVWASWPEPTVRTVRLPYGEAMPKTVRAEGKRQQQARTVAAVTPPAVPAAAPEPELVATEPESLDRGPAAVRSELELEDDGYAESAEQLGAEPLPGFGGASGADQDQPATKASPQPSERPAEALDEPVIDALIVLPPSPSPPHDER